MSWEIVPSTSRLISGEVTVLSPPKLISELKDGKGFTFNAFVRLGSGDSAETFTLKFWLKNVERAFAEAMQAQLPKSAKVKLSNETLVIEERDGEVYPTVHLNHDGSKQPVEEPTPPVDVHPVLDVDLG